MKRPHVRILGASARAAAWSVHRSGGTVSAIDLFADEDFPVGTEQTRLQLINSQIVYNYCCDEQNRVEAGSLLLTGPCENFMRGFREPSPKRPVNDPVLNYCLPAWVSCEESIRRARYHLQLAELLKKKGFPVLQITRSTTVDKKIKWLLKSCHSIGGIDIRFFDPASENIYLTLFTQEYKEGLSCSAQFVSWQEPGDAHQTEFLGLTRQDTNSTARPEFPFLYGGNAFPLEQFAELDVTSCEQQVTEIGNYLATELELTGFWGFDFIWAEEQPFLLEINPRYTNSLELIELNQQRALLSEFAERLHIPGDWQPAPSQPPTSAPAIIKQIYYAPKQLRINEENFWARLITVNGGEYPYRDPWQVPTFSDLPVVGSDFAPGIPICTIWGTGATGVEAEQVLSDRRQQLDAALQLT